MNFNHFTYWNKQRVVTVEVLWMSFLPRVFPPFFLYYPHEIWDGFNITSCLLTKTHFSEHLSPSCHIILSPTGFLCFTKNSLFPETNTTNFSFLRIFFFLEHYF